MKKRWLRKTECEAWSTELGGSLIETSVIYNNCEYRSITEQPRTIEQQVPHVLMQTKYTVTMGSSARKEVKMPLTVFLTAGRFLSLSEYLFQLP